MWFTLKDIGKTQVFNAQAAVQPDQDDRYGSDHQPRELRAQRQREHFAYVTIGGLNEVKVFRTDDFSQVATIPVGNLPHGMWPSGDGSRIYVGLENGDALAAIDTATNMVIANDSDRTGAAGDRLCTGRRPQSGRSAEPASHSASRGRPRTSLSASKTGSKGDTGSNERLAVRPGPDPDPAKHRSPGSSQSKTTCLRWRIASTEAARSQALRRVHDQSRGLGHRQCDRPNPADRQ